MKRVTQHPGPERGREKQPRRQDPVACELCRKMKLKCDRGAPCSNCHTRKVTCSLSSGTDERPGACDNISTSLNELCSRVKRLEDALGLEVHLENRRSNSPSGPHARAEPSSEIHTTKDSDLSNAVTLVETDSTQETTWPNSPLDSKVAEGLAAFIFSLPRPCSGTLIDEDVRVTLPPRHDGEALLEHYVTNITWIYHIIHVPTIKNQFDNLYSSIEQNHRPNYGYLALICTIFSLSAYFTPPSSCADFEHAESMKRCRNWALLAQEALLAADSLAKPTLEALQCLILMAQHLMPNIGPISTLRTVAGTILNMARALSLHQVDSPSNKKLRENSQVDWVDIEVKRRIWWHIASTDWIMSFMSGDHCGTYAVHPKQMSVEIPSNVDDVAINSQGGYAQPWYVLTDMTNLNFRIYFARTLREIVDTVWDAGGDIDELPYEIVLKFDGQLNKLVSELNERLSFIATTQATSGSDGPRLATTTRLGIIGNLSIHTRLCRLHRPYLVRGAQDPRYAYSRMICLRSARTVIEIGKGLTSTESLEYIKMWTVNLHIFASTVILVMDYYFNRDEPRARERKEEIFDCFRVLESARVDSTTVIRGLRRLRNVLGEREIIRDGVDNRSLGSPAVSSSVKNMPPQSTVLEAEPHQQPLGAESVYKEPSGVTNGVQFNSGASPYHATGLDYAWFEQIDFDDKVEESQFKSLFEDIVGNREAF